MTILINEAMKIERAGALRATAYERTPERQGHANGYKPKNVKSRPGNLALSVPQVRGGIESYPSALGKGERSERALKLAMAEMYIQGVTTRKVSSVLEKLCGLEFSSSDVSRVGERLDNELRFRRNRPLGEVLYLMPDARIRKGAYERIGCRLCGSDHHGRTGRRETLDPGSRCLHQRSRGSLARVFTRPEKHGVKQVSSDDHSGLRTAMPSSLPGVVWQRWVHLQRNAAAYVPRTGMREAVAADLRSIFNALNRKEADRLLAKTIEKYSEKADRPAVWPKENIPDGLTVFTLPEKHQRRLRTTNMAERQNREIRRRTRA